MSEWISVKDRPPKSGEHVRANCVCGGYRYECTAFYSAPKTKVYDPIMDEVDGVYDEETDEYYLPEGWWEVIHNWDEYGFVWIADKVTHWHPLSEPPEEG